MTSSEKTTGLVLGKFMPPHNGHVYLIDFARHYVDQLTIYVDSLPSQPIPGSRRANWLRQMFPDAVVQHPECINPQYPHEHPDFWQIWKSTLLKATGGPVDYLFASEDYGIKLAEVIGATFVPVDIERSAVPVSGTKIRKDPIEHWEHIPRLVRPYYVKRICIFGPESTGKTTLTKNLAQHFKTVAVPEYARTHLEHRNTQVDATDIPLIAKGQIAVEDSLALNANRLLFCDTDLLTTTIWSNWLFNSCDDWIVKEAEQRQYDLYLVTDVDVPWVADQVRYLPEERVAFFNRCIEELKQRNRPFHIVRGDWNERLQSAIKAVNSLLHKHVPDSEI